MGVHDLRVEDGEVQFAALVHERAQSHFGGVPLSVEHGLRAEAGPQRDAIGAVRLMDEHLAHVERDLAHAGRGGRALDLRSALLPARP